MASRPTERQFDPQAVTLVGDTVALETPRAEHLPSLFAAARDPVVFRYSPVTPWATLDEAAEWLDGITRAMLAGAEVPFIIVHRSSGDAIGTTRYVDLQRAHRALEIGFTWLTPAHQRTAANTESKLLLLTHAFETLGAIRVQLKTDGRNVQSQEAIRRLGATFEGVLRRHRVMPDGYVRDSVFFSILDEEWPAVKTGLQARLGRH